MGDPGSDPILILDNYLASYYTVAPTNAVAECNAVKISVFSDSGFTTQLKQGTAFGQAGGSATDNVDTAVAIDLVTTVST